MDRQSVSSTSPSRLAWDPAGCTMHHMMHMHSIVFTPHGFVGSIRSIDESLALDGLCGGTACNLPLWAHHLIRCKGAIMLSSQLALLATFAAGVVGAPAVDTPAKIRFEGHQVVRCNASPSTVDALRAIATANPSLDWWTPPVRRSCMHTLRNTLCVQSLVLRGTPSFALKHANDVSNCACSQLCTT